MLNYGWRLQMGVFAASCVFVFHNYTFFESITVWQGESGQLVYGVADYHGFNEVSSACGSLANHAHTSDMFNVFSELKKKKNLTDYLAIIEDIIGYNGKNKEAQGFITRCRMDALIRDYQYDSPLVDLGERLARYGSPFVNAEHRFLRQCGLAAVREEGALNEKGEFPTRCTISGHDIVQEYEQTKSEIERYSDNPLRQYYRQALQFVHNPSAASVLKSVKRDRTGIVQYINRNVPAEHRLFFGEALRLFDAPLVDARVAHLILAHPTTKKIILLLGAAHIYPLGEILKQWRGFKEVAHVGVRREYPYEPTTFDPTQEEKNKEKIMLSPLESAELELIGADDPQRFMAGSFS